MAKTNKIPMRSEVRTEDTWDLNPLFKSDAAWKKMYAQLTGQLEEFGRFRGWLGESAETLAAFCVFQTEFEKNAERLGNYAFLRSSEDLTSSKYQGMVAQFEHLAMLVAEATSFFAPELRNIPKRKMDAFLEDPALEPFRLTLERLLRYRPHILSEKEERILAMQVEVAGTADRVFSQLNDADLTFGSVKNEKGEMVELSQGSFRSFLESPNREVRKTAFLQFYKVYEAHSHTLAATLSSSVLQDVYQSRVRNFPSARESALFGDRIPLGVYDNLVSAVHGNLDVVYRYFKIRRKALKLKDIHFYDTYVPIVEGFSVRRPYDKAVETVCAALEPLGEDYVKTLEKGLRGRWVDRYENQGKRSGAFSGGGYAGPPYILMNYREDVLDSVFTLAHEAGHSMHTYYSAKTQPFQDYHYSLFVAEVASTFNEILLNRYLMDRAKNRAQRAYLINREIDEIRGTLVRQTMFAEFEALTHAFAEAGEPLTLERIRNEYRRLLDLYFGEDFRIDDELELEALRIPHFYSSFYVYKYATGLSAAIALAEQVLEGGDRARNRYLRFLSSGCSQYPLDLLRDAGVDMEKPEPVAAAMMHFERLVGELEEAVLG